MGVYKILKYPKMYWRTCGYAELVAAHTTAKGTGKTRNEERRNGKREMKKWAFNCMLSLHSATPGVDFCHRSQQRGSRDYSIIMHQLNTKKYCRLSRVLQLCDQSSYRTSRTVCGLDKLVEQLFQLEYSRLLQPAFEQQGSAALRSMQQLESSKI